MPGQTVAALLAELDAEQQRLRELVADRDEALLATRPANGKWSVLENLRHLLFVEQAHLGGFVPDGHNWHPRGYTPQAMLEAKRLRPPDSAALPRVADVLEAWAAVHGITGAALLAHDTDEVRYRLARHIQHQRSHIQTIERLLRRW